MPGLNSQKVSEQLMMSACLEKSNNTGENGFVYGHRNITLDLKDEGETCGKNRVYKIMRQAGIKAIRGYINLAYKYT